MGASPTSATNAVSTFLLKASASCSPGIRDLKDLWMFSLMLSRGDGAASIPTHTFVFWTHGRNFSVGMSFSTMTSTSSTLDRGSGGPAECSGMEGQLVGMCG